MELGRLCSRARKLDTFFKILRSIIFACIIAELCVMTVLTIVNAVNPGAVIGEKLNELNLGRVTFQLAEAHTPDNAAILGYAWACAVPEAIAGAAACIAIGYIRRILAPMKEGSPFRAGAVRNFRRLALLSLVLGIVRNAAGMIKTFFALRAFGLDSFAGDGFIQAVRANYSWDFSYIVAFFVLLLMAYIFSYGAQLQQLSDETL